MNNGTILKQRYKILRHIGSGGMAEVYLAEDLLLNRQVAIKILRDQFNDDKTLLNQFKHEAQSAARLSSPSIINILMFAKKKASLLSLWNMWKAKP